LQQLQITRLVGIQSQGWQVYGKENATDINPNVALYSHIRMLTDQHSDTSVAGGGLGQEFVFFVTPIGKQEIH
jgi:hypothetical protein